MTSPIQYLTNPFLGLVSTSRLVPNQIQNRTQIIALTALAILTLALIIGAVGSIVNYFKNPKTPHTTQQKNVKPSFMLNQEKLSHALIHKSLNPLQ